MVQDTLRKGKLSFDTQHVEAKLNYTLYIINYMKRGHALHFPNACP